MSQVQYTSLSRILPVLLKNLSGFYLFSVAFKTLPFRRCGLGLWIKREQKSAARFQRLPFKPFYIRS